MMWSINEISLQIFLRIFFQLCLICIINDLQNLLLSSMFIIRQSVVSVKRLSNLRLYPGKHLRVVIPVPSSSLFAFFNFFKGLIGAGESTSFRAALASSQPAPGTANLPALLPRKPLCFSMTAKKNALRA